MINFPKNKCMLIAAEVYYFCYLVQSQLPDHMLITIFCVCSGNTSLFTQTKLVNVRLIT